MTDTTRREFLSSTAGALVAAAGLPAIRPQHHWRGHALDAHDVVVRGGRLLDPAQGIDAVRDIGITRGRVTDIAEQLSIDDVSHVVDARGKLVTPGMIDVHTHVYPGVPTLGIDPDLVGIARGVTTVVDAGSAGAVSFPGFRDYVARPARTRVYGLVNMSRTGMTAPNELALLDYVDVDAVVRTIEESPEVAVGIKVRMLSGIEDRADIEVMRRTREAADRAGVPVTVHIGGQSSPLPRILEFLRPGDVITHAFRRTGSILDDGGRVYPEVREAIENGVWLDIGHGRGNLDFDVAERILDQGVRPQLISSDVHDGNVTGPVFDLPTNVSKFMALGMSLEECVAACTDTAAKVFAYGAELGTLRPGAAADVSVFEVVEGDYTFVDATGNTRPGSRRLVPYVTLRDGLPYGVARG
ncbi:MAG: amidohydrolase/deacetylase family metallohydrolase [Gemmatimonadota bacterium]|nr:amidohydrolase/deacetylase family metallohydrolase [Gemmatimonadota bacterium]